MFLHVDVSVRCCILQHVEITSKQGYDSRVTQYAQPACQQTETFDNTLKGFRPIVGLF
jgi:hypothetical protein